MKALVIAELPARPDGVADVEAALRAALPDTRAFEGCISVDVYFEPSTSTFILVEDWESHDHYDRYMNWRMETGLADLLEPLLAGGTAGLFVRKFDNTDI
jgi:quinol monooxygenase YgiN